MHIVKNSPMAGLILALMATVAGCSSKAHQDIVPPQATLAFTCVNQVDRLPLLDPQSNSWFKQARDLQNASGEKDYNVIANLYRQATEKDHYKAMINLQNLLYLGLAAPVSGKAAPEEVIALAEKLMQLNIPAGYYAMGHYLEVGYGVERDKAASLAYFRKSADMGSPEGQYVIGKLLLTAQFEDLDNPEPYKIKYKPNPAFRPEVATEMLSCAANQGNGDAASWLAGWYKIKKDYKKAIIYYQLGVKAGNRFSAMQLRGSFKGAESDDRRYYLAVEKDLERAHLYDIIYREAQNNPSARFPDIDQIVPLPPASLPDWDGTFEYKKAK